MYIELSCKAALKSLNQLSPNNIFEPNARVSKPPITNVIAPLALATVPTVLAKLHDLPNHFPLASKLTALALPKNSPAAPSPPNTPPKIAPVTTPSLKPSQNEPPDAQLDSPPIRPPLKAPFNEPIKIPEPSQFKPGTKQRTTPVITTAIARISFQCSWHHSPTFLQPSLNFSQPLFSHSGFRYSYLS